MILSPKVCLEFMRRIATGKMIVGGREIIIQQNEIQRLVDAFNTYRAELCLIADQPIIVNTINSIRESIETKAIEEGMNIEEYSRFFSDPEMHSLSIQQLLSLSNRQNSIIIHNSLVEEDMMIAVNVSMRMQFLEVRHLESKLGLNSTPAWGQHDRAWWSNPQNVNPYLEDLRSRMRVINPDGLMLSGISIADTIDARIRGKIKMCQLVDIPITRESLFADSSDEDEPENPRSLFDINERRHAERRRTAGEQAEQNIKREEINKQSSELSGAAAIDENIINRWIAIESAAKEQALAPESNVSIVRHYDNLRSNNFNHIGHTRISFEEARVLESQLGRNGTPPWGQHNVEWWSNAQNAEGYLGDLRGQLSQQKQKFEEARALESQLGLSSTPEWGQHNAEWWGNAQNVEGYLGDLRGQVSQREHSNRL